MAGFDADAVDETLERLEAAGLVDDRRFAHALVEHHTAVRLAGRRAVMSALLAKGVDRETAEAELADAGDEQERALELAQRRATRLRGVDPGVALRRLTDFLIRRGHVPGTARDAARRALRLEADGLD
jgi:regulatory protein